MACATSEDSGQPAHPGMLTRDFAGRCIVSLTFQLAISRWHFDEE